jgi:D-arabinose 1-dehydrogenase-like Zn-dependent alcohol dehydrogenase
MPFKLPGIAGHEVAGYIDEVGENVAVFKSGDPVIVGPHLQVAGSVTTVSSGNAIFVNKPRPKQDGT